MTDQTNKDLPPLPQGYRKIPADYQGDVYLESQVRAYARATLAASAPADILRMRQQLEQEWCELRKLKASYASAPQEGK